MKIHQLTRDFEVDKWGGIEQVILNYSQLLEKKGHTSTMSAWYINQDKKNIYKDLGLNMVSISPIPPHLKNYDFDLLHWHGMYPGLCWLAPYLIKENIPVVISLHSSDAYRTLDLYFKGPYSRYWSTKGLRRLWALPRFKKLLPQVKIFVCHSHEHIALMKECFPNHQIEYLPNGVNVERFSKGDGLSFRKKYRILNNAFIVLAVARIDRVKNQHLLVELLPEMLKICPDIHLVLVGSCTHSEYKAFLEKKILELKVENFITMIPGFYTHDQSLVDAYHACDIFVLPSEHEVGPLALLEACAAGKSIIASKVGNIPLVIDDGKSGLLHEPGNKTEMLSCFKRVVLDGDYRNKLGCAAREQVSEKFSWDVIGNRLVDLYQSVIKNK